MARCYRILFKEDEMLGVGYTADKSIFHLPYIGRIENWEPPLLELRDGDFPDYLASNFGGRICSARLRDVLARGASEEDVLQWLEVRVHGARGEQAYFLLHFPHAPDVLDKEKTIFAEDFVVKPVFSGALLANHRVFTYPRNQGRPLFVVKEVRRAIEEVECTGLHFSQVRVT